MEELEALGVKRIASIIGANDGGQIGFQCDRLSGAYHHTVDDFNYLEVIDENGNPCPTGTPGRLVLTSLLKYAYPLIRYEVGDMARFVTSGQGGTCACGRSKAAASLKCSECSTQRYRRRFRPERSTARRLCRWSYTKAMKPPS